MINEEERKRKLKEAGVPKNTPGLWREKWKQGNRYIMKNTVTGEERPHEYGAKDREMIRRGDLIQPHEKEKFIEKFGHHPNEDQKDVDKYLFRHGLNRPRPKEPIHKKHY